MDTALPSTAIFACHLTMLFIPNCWHIWWATSKWQGLLLLHTVKSGDRGSTVVKVLLHKSEGRWFNPRWCHWNF
jgi:hypothetical protein